MEHGATLIWLAGLDKGCYYFNQTRLQFTGRTLEQEYGNGWAMGPGFEAELLHELSLAALMMEKIRADVVLKLQQALEQMAHYDALTKLPNRVSLLAQLRKKMAWSQRENQHLAVAFIDLDGFKEVNDRYSHVVGDELLVALARRIKTQLRPTMNSLVWAATSSLCCCCQTSKGLPTLPR